MAQYSLSDLSSNLLRCRSIRKEYMMFAHNREVKSDPRSDIIGEATLCNCMTSCVMTYANFLAIISERQGM